MKPNENIRAQVRTVVKSQSFHMLIVEGRAGIGKTTALSRALSEFDIAPAILGAYCTPLGLFNFLLAHRESVVLVDDTAGVLLSPLSMSILKAATWAQPGRGRVLRWTSTTERADACEFTFTGKIFLACNSFPTTPDAVAVKNRSLDLIIDPGLVETKELLTTAAKNEIKFPDQKTVARVLKKILRDLTEETLSRVSYRTLEKAYEIAVHNPDSWEEMHSSASGRSTETSPHDIVLRLSRTDLNVKDQLREFERVTGFKRRSFFKYRKQLDLAKT